MNITRVGRSALVTILAGLAAPPAFAQRPEQVKVLIAFQAAFGKAERELVLAAGGRIDRTFHLVPAVSATVPVTAINRLRADPVVRGVDLDGAVQADGEFDDTWGVHRIGAESVHAGGNTGSGVRVGVIDSGIDALHPDLDDNHAGGWDFVSDDGDPTDDFGHGTHVSGTVAAEANGTGVVGVAPDAALYGIKVLDARGGGSWADVIAGVQWCVDHGIQVTNNSYGSSQNPGSIVRDAFDAAAAAGVLQVASAGNSGSPAGAGNSVVWPGRYDSVVAVAATDANDLRAAFSSTGDQVEIAAPGVDILSTTIGAGYGTADGTSMASPHVAGTAALLIAAGITDRDLLRQRLRDTALDLGDPGRDPHYGFGLVDAAGAVPSSPPSGPPDNGEPVVTILSPDDGSTFPSGAAIAFAGTAVDPESGDLTAGLLWFSSLDGQIGSGGSFSTSLSDGAHTITASATDPQGETASASESITVGSPSGPTSVRVASIVYTTTGGKHRDKHLAIALQVLDDLEDPVSGASVSVTVSSTTGSWSMTSSTAADGTAVFSLKNAAAGSYSTQVTEVLAPPLSWDGVTPQNGFEK